MIRSMMRSRPTSRSREKELCDPGLFSEVCEWWRSCKLVKLFIQENELEKQATLGRTSLQFLVPMSNHSMPSVTMAA